MRSTRTVSARRCLVALGAAGTALVVGMAVPASAATTHAKAKAKASACPAGNARITSRSFSVNGKGAWSTLAGHARSGAGVAARFTVAQGCDNVKVSLAAYDAGGGGLNRGGLSSQRLVDSATGTFGPGPHTLALTRALPCSFQVDFVRGSVITSFGPSGSKQFYGSQGRLMDFARGSATNCGNPGVGPHGGPPPGTPGTPGPTAHPAPTPAKPVVHARVLAKQISRPAARSLAVTGANSSDLVLVGLALVLAGLGAYGWGSSPDNRWQREWAK